jgi:hypothetical protein
MLLHAHEPGSRAAPEASQGFAHVGPPELASCTELGGTDVPGSLSESELETNR